MIKWTLQAIDFYANRLNTASGQEATCKAEFNLRYLQSYEVYWGRIADPLAAVSQQQESNTEQDPLNCDVVIANDERKCVELENQGVVGLISLRCDTSVEGSGEVNSTVVGPMPWYELPCDVARDVKDIGQLECVICNGPDLETISQNLVRVIPWCHCPREWERVGGRQGQREELGRQRGRQEGGSE